MWRDSFRQVPAHGVLALCLGLSLLLAGCAPLVQPEQAAVEQWVALQAGAPLGQTFVAEYDGLQAVWLLLEPESPGEGSLTLHLRADPFSETDLGTASMPLQAVTVSRPYRFDFPALGRSSQQDYYFFFEVTGDGSLRAASGPADTYLDGAAYQNHQPLDAQLAFSLDYAPGALGLGLVRESLAWAGVLGAGLLLYILPGWAVLSLAWRGWERLGWGEKLGLAAGASLGLVALFVLYTGLAGIRLGAGYVWLPVVLSGAWLLKGWLRRGGLRAALAAHISLQKILRHPGGGWLDCWPDITLVVLLALIFGARFWAIRGLDAPLWGDSVQHTLMAQLILDRGGLFDSWQPYAPYISQSMQFGFPLAAAQFSWLSGANSLQAVLWAGQLLNGLSVLALYPLAVRLAGGQRWAGVAAVLAAGLLSPMPAFYFNWGRYAQLAGQVVLPVAAWMVWDLLEEPFQPEKGRLLLPRAKLALAGAVLAGMVLCQYRMPFFYLAFVIAWVIGWGLPRWRGQFSAWRAAIARLAGVALVGILLFLPWGLRVMGNSGLLDVATADSQGAALAEIVLADYRAWLDIDAYMPLPLVALALAAWVWGTLRRHWAVLAVGLWLAVSASIYTWNLLHIPGAQQVSAFAVMISIYMPVGLLLGWLAGQVADALRGVRVGGVALALVLMAAGVLAAQSQASLALPQDFALVTRPDLRAMDWIRGHTPLQAHFLVEGFRAYWNTTAVGADAGWWLPLLAERSSTMPPLYALTGETPLEAGYSQRMIQLVAELETASLDHPASLDLLCDEGITHVYIGQGQGLVGASGEALFTPQEMTASQAFELVYRQDRVWIFALQPEVCGE